MAISTIEDIPRVHGAGRPDATFATFDGESVTWGEVQARSNQVAQGLLGEGIRRESRVAIIAKNGPAIFEVLFGARKVGAVQVAINWRLSADEMHFIVEDAGAEVLFVDEPFLDIAVAIAPRLPTVRKVIALAGTKGGFEGYTAWLARQKVVDTGFRSRPSDVALQLYTSGTTGRPKGAMLMNSSLFAWVEGAVKAFGFDPNGVHLNCLPLFHVGGINWSLQAFAQGAQVISFRDFDADGLIAEIQKSRVTHLMTVPAVIQLLLSRPSARTTDFSSLKVIIYGGSTISEKVLLDAIATFGNCLFGMYGSTELSFGATVLTPAEHVDKAHPEWLRSCGRPLEGSALRGIGPGTLTDLPEGKPGELRFRSPQRGNGYWNRPEASAEIFRSDGWYRSGDLGHQLGGYIYLSDRLNDMIISGGENIYPAEIERVFSAHPDVSEVVAFGVPDEGWGEAVHAVVVRTATGKADAQALLDFAREKLAKFKLPKVVTFAEALPKTASGKVQRETLRAPHWAGRSRRIA